MLPLTLLLFVAAVSVSRAAARDRRNGSTAAVERVPFPSLLLVKTSSRFLWLRCPANSEVDCRSSTISLRWLFPGKRRRNAEMGCKP
ncbi:hypothetical protein DFH08DRAFT_871040 [Mycena albidolilacea]|uniref:Secreted protein n=1 Tax=Mycena albidolilacea TaxID=1033008 RepID=A0AAD7ER53_9AGAR|nr:hypothetical protein DFH08DRAFT_871040 [Mycena albidolilacea]